MPLKLDYESRSHRQNKTRARMAMTTRLAMDLAIITVVITWLALTAWDWRGCCCERQKQTGDAIAGVY